MRITTCAKVNSSSAKFAGFCAIKSASFPLELRRLRADH
jgi:hypothetical protein